MKHHSTELTSAAERSADSPAEPGYRGVFDSVTAYAEALVDDLGSEQLLDELLPPGLRPYVRIDTAALSRDLVIGGTIRVEANSNGGIIIFDGR
jgi:hypothetical protein